MQRYLRYGVAVLLASVAATVWIPPGMASFIVGMWTPALVALLLVLAERRPLGVLWGPRKADVRAFGIALLLPLAIAAAVAASGLALGLLHAVPDHPWQWSRIIPTLLIAILAALGEELGWRGYLQATLPRPATAPLWVAAVWFLWHLPGMLAAGEWTWTSLAVFAIVVAQLSYVFAWVLRSTGSVAACAVMHGSWNTLRTHVLEGAPERPAAFSSSAPMLTQMEGILGICVLAAVLWLLYRGPLRIR